MCYRVAILGATGAVGHEFLHLLARDFLPVKELVLLASARSAGRTLQFRGEDLRVTAVGPQSFERIDIAFFSAGASRSLEWAKIATEAGALVVDNSSAFRMDPEVPLVVPEVNGHVLTPNHRLVANPNCTAAILLMAIEPLRRLAPIKRLVVSTYQSASGAGAAAMEELRTQTLDVLEGRDAIPHVLPHPYAFNLFSHNTAIDETGSNGEEAKVMAECRRMLEQPDLAMSVTCVRVPVMRAHSLSVNVEFVGKRPSLSEIHRALNEANGVRVVDDRQHNVFPMPVTASGIDEVLVGRIREDQSHPLAVNLFICGDQLLKGAALNAVQIAQLAHERRWVNPAAVIGN